MQHAFGDAIGSSTHIALSGWTPKPFTTWWHHPIFTWQGAWNFLSELLASFWRGEFNWHGKRLASAAADYFYVISSLLFIGITALHLPWLARSDKVTSQVVSFALLSFIAAVLFLAFISIRFDFGDSVYPSRAEPYLWSGRYITGALIPFTIVYAGIRPPPRSSLDTTNLAAVRYRIRIVTACYGFGNSSQSAGILQRL